MKRILVTIMLIALICTSAFAADVAAKVMLTTSLGDDGFSITNNDGIWNPVISLSTSGDAAGAEFKFVLLDWGKTIDMRTSVWISPFEIDHGIKDVLTDISKLTITIGTNSSVSFKEGIEFSNVMTYIIPELTYQYDNYSDKCSFADVSLAFAYKPFFDGSKDADFYVGGSIGYENSNAFQLAWLAEYNLRNGKASMNYGETDGSFSLGNIKGVTAKLKKSFLTQPFGFDDTYYFNYKDYSDASSVVKSWNDNVWTVGLGYKYFTEEDKKDQTGVYGFGIANYYTTGTDFGIQIQAEAEIGGSNAKLELGSKGNKGSFSWIVNDINCFDYSSDFESRIDEVYAKFTNPVKFNNAQVKGSCAYLYVNYYNKPNYAVASNGIFFKPGLIFSVGSCNLDTSFRFGFDATQAFRWKGAVKSTVNF